MPRKCPTQPQKCLKWAQIALKMASIAPKRPKIGQKCSENALPSPKNAQNRPKYALDCAFCGQFHARFADRLTDNSCYFSLHTQVEPEYVGTIPAISPYILRQNLRIRKIRNTRELGNRHSLQADLNCGLIGANILGEYISVIGL